MILKVTSITLVLLAGLIISGIPDVEAAPGAAPRGKSSGTPGRSSGGSGSKSPPPRRVSITAAALQAAAPLYRKNLNKLMQTRTGARTPKPNVSPSPAGNVPMALPSGQPRKARTWSMTATRGQRNSIVSSRTYSSGSLSDTSSSASSASSTSTSTTR